jgi:hypothetical protein
MPRGAVDTGSSVWYTKPVLVQRVKREEPMVNSKSSLRVVVIIVVVGLLIIGALWTYNDLKAVARVNSTNITWKQFNDALKKQSGNQMLAGLLREELIRQGAKQHNITVIDEDVQSELDRLADQFGSTAGLEQVLSQYGMSLDDLRGQIKSTLLLEGIAAKDVTVQMSGSITYLSSPSLIASKGHTSAHVPHFVHSSVIKCGNPATPSQTQNSIISASLVSSRLSISAINASVSF